MYLKKIIESIFIIGIALLLSACRSTKLPPSKGGYYHSNIYFGAFFTQHYKEGIRDGCTTAKGTYKKSHWLFNNSNDYNNGWFLGRNRCKDQLVIDDK